MTETSESPFKAGYAVIVGRPNVGKSTLLNNFLHFKISAVTSKPQTTRHQIRGILNEQNFQVIFLDTPGFLQPKYRLQEAMVQAARSALKDADLVLFLIEAASHPDHADVLILEEIASIGCPIILVINKIDAIARGQVLPLIDHFRAYEQIVEIVPISALKSENLETLKEQIVKYLPEGPPFYPPDQITDHPERFIVAEIIREKIFQKYGDEIPYATTVAIDEFQERQSGKDFIKATIYVEKSSQKGILVGRKGEALKKVGKMAREEIESVLDRPVFLELWVKVKEKWRKDDQSLKEFGYF